MDSRKKLYVLMEEYQESIIAIETRLDSMPLYNSTVRQELQTELDRLYVLVDTIREEAR